MLRYVGQRVLILVFVMIAVSFITFMILEPLGDPIQVVLGPLSADPDLRAETAAELGLDRSVFVRYFDWLGGVLQGDLGRSYIGSREPVTQTLADSWSSPLPTSLHLMVQSMFLAILIAVPTAMLAASRAGGAFDRIVTGLASALISVPNFAMAIILGYTLGVRFQVFDAIYTADGNIFVRSMSLMLPSLALALGLAAIYVRVLRTDLVTTLQEDYVVAARAAGLPEWEVLLRHALRPSSLTLLTIMGINVGALLGGALIVEVIFQVPGMGMIITNKLLTFDYVVIVAIVAIISGVFVLSNMLVDVLYGWLDPRVRADA